VFIWQKTPELKADYVVTIGLFAVIFVLSSVYFYLNSNHAAFYQDYFRIAVQMYCGYGSTYLESSHWTATQISEHSGQNFSEIKCSEYASANPVKDSYYSAWHNKHILLSSLMAVCWKILGLSQENLWPISGLLGGLTVVAIYLLPRILGVPVVISLLSVALINWHTMLNGTLMLRDFSKTPFLILVMVFCGALLIRTSSKSVKFFTLPASLGTIIAIGIGFREDCIIGLPISFLVLIAATLTIKKGKLIFFFLATFSLTLSFLIIDLIINQLGSPEAAKMEGTGHILILGLAQQFFDTISFTNIGYVILSHYSDALAWATVDWWTPNDTTYVTDLTGNHGKASIELYQRYILFFPYDYAMRMLTSVAALVSKFWRLEQIYIWIIMILTVSCLGRYKIAFFVSLTILYFSAVSSLQFDFRHLQHIRYVEQSLLISLVYWIYRELRLFYSSGGLKTWHIVFQRIRWHIVIGASLCIAFFGVFFALLSVQKINFEKHIYLLNSLDWEPFSNSKSLIWESKTNTKTTAGILKIKFNFDGCNDKFFKLQHDLDDFSPKVFLIKNPKFTGGEPNRNVEQGIYLTIYPPHILTSSFSFVGTRCIPHIFYGEAGGIDILPLNVFEPATALQNLSIRKIWTDLTNFFVLKE